MSRRLARSSLYLAPILIGVMMVTSSALAIKLKPSHRLADQLPPISLEQAIPQSFGTWHIDKSIIPINPSPDVQSRLNELYNQMLARTYANGQGQRIMLSISYGADQSGDGSQVHRPEFCYTAQGFQIAFNRIGDLLTQYGDLPVRRLLALQGARSEPITYWITVGDKATLPGISRKLSQIAYGLTGKVPDGMLVRVSSLDTDTDHAYQVQQDFIRDLLAALAPENRLRIAGRLKEG